MNRLLWSMTPRRTLLAISMIVAAVTGLAVAGEASASTGGDRRVVARLRAVSAQYRSVDRAIADGFVATEGCAALPGVGGMGYHYVNPERLADGVIDPDRPDILLYTTARNGRLRLAGVEWFSPDPDQDLSTVDGRPVLFGRSFDGPMPGHEPGMPIHFDLHAWVWQDNPAGTFAPWNASVTCP